jgi:hypothetical protein
MRAPQLAFSMPPIVSRRRDTAPEPSARAGDSGARGRADSRPRQRADGNGQTSPPFSPSSRMPAPGST